MRAADQAGTLTAGQPVNLPSIIPGHPAAKSCLCTRALDPLSLGPGHDRPQAQFPSSVASFLIIFTSHASAHDDGDAVKLVRAKLLRGGRRESHLDDDLIATKHFDFDKVTLRTEWTGM